MAEESALAKYAHGQRSNELRRIRRALDPEYNELFMRRELAHCLRRRYGITPEEAGALYGRQAGCCAICLTPGVSPLEPGVKSAGKLNIDHCHTTGRVRGLLCHMCNTALGKFKDSADILRRAIDYVHHV